MSLISPNSDVQSIIVSIFGQGPFPELLEKALVCIKIKLLKVPNPYKPSVLFVEQVQTVQTQIRISLMLCKNSGGAQACQGKLSLMLKVE